LAAIETLVKDKSRPRICPAGWFAIHQKTSHHAARASLNGLLAHFLPAGRPHRRISIAFRAAALIRRSQ
jgi:hypothetical protein